MIKTLVIQAVIVLSMFLALFYGCIIAAVKLA